MMMGSLDEENAILANLEPAAKNDAKPTKTRMAQKNRLLQLAILSTNYQLFFWKLLSAILFLCTLFLADNWWETQKCEKSRFKECPKPPEQQLCCSSGSDGKNFWSPTEFDLPGLTLSNSGLTISLANYEKTERVMGKTFEAYWPLQISYNQKRVEYFEVKIVKNYWPYGPNYTDYKQWSESTRRTVLIGLQPGHYWYYSQGDWSLGGHNRTFGKDGDIVGCGLLPLASDNYEIFFTNNGEKIETKYMLNGSRIRSRKLFPTTGFSLISNLSIELEANFGYEKYKPFKFNISQMEVKI